MLVLRDWDKVNNPHCKKVACMVSVRCWYGVGNGWYGVGNGLQGVGTIGKVSVMVGKVFCKWFTAAECVYPFRDCLV